MIMPSVVSPTQSSDSGAGTQCSDLSMPRPPSRRKQRLSSYSNNVDKGKGNGRKRYVSAEFVHDSDSERGDTEEQSESSASSRPSSVELFLESSSDGYSSLGSEMEKLKFQHKQGNQRTRILSSSSGSGPSSPENYDPAEDNTATQLNGGGGKVDDEYEIEKIEAMRGNKKGRREFFVKWLGYDSSQNTWEPEMHLENCKEMIAEFLKEQNNLRKKKSKWGNGKRKSRKSGHSTKQPKLSLSTTVESTKKELESEDLIITASVSMKSALMEINSNYDHSEPPKDDSTLRCDDDSDDPIVPIQFPPLRHSGMFFFRILDANEIGMIYVNLLKPTKTEIFYKCVVTEDLTGRDVKFVFGATTSESGDLFCLVQFEKCDYVEIVPPDVLFKAFPAYRKFYELQSPSLFPKSSQ